jgi:hypothetical protein
MSDVVILSRGLSSYRLYRDRSRAEREAKIATLAEEHERDGDIVWTYYVMRSRDQAGYYVVAIDDEVGCHIGYLP